MAALKPAVEDRRAFAKIIAASFEREKTVDARARFVELQATIEAIDRAIEDEEGGQGSLNWPTIAFQRSIDCIIAPLLSSRRQPEWFTSDRCKATPAAYAR